jgi:hypothetical protein
MDHNWNIQQTFTVVFLAECVYYQNHERKFFLLKTSIDAVTVGRLRVFPQLPYTRL